MDPGRRILPVEEGSDAIEGAYDIETEQPLAQGGFSTVWAAADKETGDLVAIKKIAKYIENEHHSWAEDEKLIKREFKNLQLVAGNPHVVELFTYYEDDDFIYMVFELLLGGELFDLILETSYPESECRLIVTQIVEAIVWCHDHDIVHRDIKPENLMAEGDGVDKLKLIDFGLSVHLPAGEKSEEQAGSPGYVAPELIKSVPYDKAVDMWSLGVTCFVVCVGFMPWDEDNPDLSVKTQIVEGLFDFDAPEWENFSAEAQNFITRCLTVDPEERMTAKQAKQHPWITVGSLSQALPSIPPLAITGEENKTPRESHITPRLKPHPKDPAHLQLIAHLIEKASRLGEKSNFCHSTPEHKPKPAHREHCEPKRSSHQDDDDTPQRPHEPRITVTPKMGNLQKDFQASMEKVNKRASVQDEEIPSSVSPREQEEKVKAELEQQAEAARAADAKAEQERLAAEKAEHERLAAEKAEQDRIAEKAEQDRVEAEKAEQERLAAEKAEQDRIAAEKAEQERLAAEKAEHERLAAEKAEHDRIAAEEAERKRLAAEKAEQERLAAEKAEQDRVAAEKAEQERLAAEKAEQERLAAEKEEQDRVAAEKAEQERIAAEEAERKRLAAEKEKAEQERLASEKAEQERQEKLAQLEATQKAERERLAALQAQLEASEKAEKERVEAEQAEKVRLEKEKLDALQAAQKADQEKLAALEAQLEAAQKKAAEKEKLEAAQKVEKEKLETAEKAEKEKQAILAQQEKLDKIKEANQKAEQERIASQATLKSEKPELGSDEAAQLRMRNPLHHKNPELTGQDIAELSEDSPLIKKQKQEEEEPKGVCPCLNDCVLF